MDWISGIPDPHRERSIFSHSSSVGDKNHKLASETSILWCVCLSLPPWLWKGHVTMMRYHSCDYITLSWVAQIQSGEPFESRVFLDFPGGPAVQGTWVQSPVPEGAIRYGALSPHSTATCCSYWSLGTLEPALCYRREATTVRSQAPRPENNPHSPQPTAAKTQHSQQTNE